MRRVLFVNHLALGSASSYRQADLAKYLGKGGFECHFIGLRPKSDGAAADVSEGWPFKSFTFWEEPLARKFHANLRLFRLQTEGVSLLHVNRANPYTASIVSIGNLPRTRLTVDMEDWDGYGGYSSYAGFYDAKGFALTLYENLFPRTGDVVLAVSHLLERRMHELGVPKEKLLFIPNGYDRDVFQPSVSGRPVREEFSLGDSPLVIYVSTFHRFEAPLHRTALAAFKRASAKVPDAKLLMVGGGNLDVGSLVAEAGLQGRTIQAGRVPREKIPQIIAAADVALHVISDHPFHKASSPMVMPEYMAMGKAVVAPKTGELEFGLADGAGLLVNRPDPYLLGDGVIQMLKDEERRRAIGERAMKRAREEYSYDVLAERLREAYSRIPIE